LEAIIGVVVGLIIGGSVGYLLARALGGGARVRLEALIEERDRRTRELQAALAEKEKLLQENADRHAALESRIARAEAEREAALRHAQERLAELRSAREELEKAFRAAAGDVLRQNSESFLLSARRELATVVGPLAETLKRQEEFVQLVEKERVDAYSGLRRQLEELARREAALQKETVTLANALRNPAVQGQWGELSLRRAAELAGLSAHCDFTEQYDLRADGDRLKPDMVVHLPGARDIVVDAKAPLNAYVDAVNAPTEEERMAKLREHASRVKAHVRRLAAKDYAAQFASSPEFTVLYLPGENFLAGALLADRGLLEDALQNGVILATPTTFIALLRAVAHGWRQAQLTEHARRISEAGRLLYRRLGKFVERFNDVGGRLNQAVHAYNAAVGSFDARLLPAVEEIERLGAAGEQTLPPLSRVAPSSRRIADIAADGADGGKASPAPDAPAQAPPD